MSKMLTTDGGSLKIRRQLSKQMKMATLVYMESTEYSVTKSILKGHLDGKDYAAVESNQVTGSVRYIPPQKLFNHNLQVGQHVYGINISDLRQTWHCRLLTETIFLTYSIKTKKSLKGKGATRLREAISI